MVTIGRCTRRGPRILAAPLNRRAWSSSHDNGKEDRPVIIRRTGRCIVGQVMCCCITCHSIQINYKSSLDSSNGQSRSHPRSQRKAAYPAFLSRRCITVLYWAISTSCAGDRGGWSTGDTLFLESRHKLHAHPPFKSLPYGRLFDQTFPSSYTGLVLALSKRNSNAAEVVIFLHRIVQVLVEYFKELEEESIRDNFVIIYELLDEMMDFGYPQTTESKILQEYITQESHKLEIQVRPPMAVTNAVSWRTEGIRYRKNEVFLDVIESVNMLVRSITQFTIRPTLIVVGISIRLTQMAMSWDQRS